MDNLGKADAKIAILRYLPGIDKSRQKFNFDISAFDWETLSKSPLLSPLLVESIIEDDNSFAVLFPSKRKYYIDNYIETTSDSTSDSTSGDISTVDTPLTQIKWHVVSPSARMTQLPLSLKSNYDNVEPFTPDDYTSAPSDYSGPEWKDAVLEEIPPPDDDAYLSAWSPFITGVSGTTQNNGSNTDDETSSTENTTTSTITIAPIKKNYINQRRVKDGLLWIVESDSFLQENMPFWVNIRKTRPPTSRIHPTFIIISIGQDSDTDSYDLYLGDNSNPFIVDYKDGGVGAWGGRMFNVDLSRILTHEENIEVGIMTIGGRLVISVNKVNLIYTRVNKGDGDNNGKLREAKIPAGPIRIYGSNIQASINVCPMTFAKQALIAVPLPSFVDEGESSPTEDIVYKGVRYDGTLGGSVCEVPSETGGNQQVYGVDCRQFVQYPGGASLPTGFGFHRMGFVKFFEGGYITASAIPNSDYYFIQMLPQTAYNIPYAGTPYYFRLKGGYNKTGIPQTGEIPSFDVISISQNDEGSDYTHVKRSATVTLYNKGGTYDYLRDLQYGIEIHMGWNGDYMKTFTGIIVSVNTTEDAGKETITLSCEDYMYILRNIPIINSPYYDGMLKFYAVKDLAERAGIINIINDWVNYSSSEYALPSGYAFTKPSVRYNSEQNLFDCAIDMLKRDESFFFFDENGSLHVKHLPGGLFSTEDGVDSDPVAYFSRNPDGDISELIMEQRVIDHDFSSVVNTISMLSVERDTRNPVIYSTSAPVEIIPYKKTALINQPALGGIEEAKVYAERLGQRIFFPIRKMSFKTVGSVLADVFDFIEVEGWEFRVIAISRKYNADSNDYTNEYNCEWLGGFAGG